MVVILLLAKGAANLPPGTEIDLTPARQIVRDMAPVQPSDLIPLLQKLQDEYGYLPRPVMEEVPEVTEIPLSRVVGVATFYEQFSLTPRGRHIIRACRGTACHVRGSKRVRTAIEKHLGVGEGETTSDLEFTYETVACLGACALAPVMVVNRDYYGKMTPGKVNAVLDSYGTRR